MKLVAKFLASRMKELTHLLRRANSNNQLLHRFSKIKLSISRLDDDFQAEKLGTCHSVSSEKPIPSRRFRPQARL